MIQMLIHTLPLLSILFLLPLLFFYFLKSCSSSNKTNKTIPTKYPLVGSYFALRSNKHRRIQWISDIVLSSSTSTITLHGLFGRRSIVTANPASVQHILKTHFSNYQKGTVFVGTLHDFLGNGIFNSNGDTWKFQRQVASHEFNTRSLRKFVENVVDTELSDRLVPILSSAAASNKNQTLDFQDVLQRFAFDNICRIAFGFDPEYLTLSSSSSVRSKFAEAYEDATEISSERFREPLAIIWKLKRKLNVGSEKRLRIAVSEVREYAKKLVREKKNELEKKQSLESEDMLSRFLSSGHSDEDFVTDIVISFILAGKDTTSAALTWFFWLLWKNPRVEEEILKEINEKSWSSKASSSSASSSSVFDEVKEMVYTHAALCESMRLYPPVPTDSKEAVNDDVLPDGTVVKKGTMVTYHVYAMGRMQSIWGDDWAEFRPERWLEKGNDGKLMFVARDSYSYPVFQAGPRICLGKEMAFLQMKRLVAGVLTRFKVVPVLEDGLEPTFISFLTSQMKGGFPVKIVHRNAFTDDLLEN